MQLGGAKVDTKWKINRRKLQYAWNLLKVFPMCVVPRYENEKETCGTSFASGTRH